jgi:5-bromo-4-chloroindolyl phosphate hydrolysis protein
VLDRGGQFLNQLRKCNDDIPGEEVSAKIYHMELILERIFARAKAHPEVIPDLKKLMDYYLHMTVKLLNAYADMDAQPVQGANIESAKREIEGTLDTLSRAFEKLLDELFQETALDVSSDITVLQTLLAQEGLTDDELTKLRNIKENA